MSNIHSCSYYCDRPECIKQQRDELRERLNGWGGETIDAEWIAVREQAAFEAGKASPQPQQAEPVWKIPDVPDLIKFINETPILQSLLYDINLLPEQIKDRVRWGYLVSLVSHYEMAIINARPPSQEQAAPGAVLEGWQPIETAPKDGTVIGVWRNRHPGAIARVRWAHHLGMPGQPLCWVTATKNIAITHMPTHWMPLPAAPSAPKPQGE